MTNNNNIQAVDSGFLKNLDGKDIICLPDEDGKDIVFDKRVANARCYISEDNSRAVLATPWGNIIIRILEEKVKEEKVKEEKC